MIFSKHFLNNKNKSTTLFVTVVLFFTIILSFFILSMMLTYVKHSDGWPIYTDNAYHYAIHYPPGWVKNPESFTQKQNKKIAHVILIKNVAQSLNSSYATFVGPYKKDEQTQLLEKRTQIQGRQIITIYITTTYNEKLTDKAYMILIGLNPQQTLLLYASATEHDVMDYMTTSLQLLK